MFIYLDFALLACAPFGLSLLFYCMNYVSKVYSYMGITKMLEAIEYIEY